MTTDQPDPRTPSSPRRLADTRELAADAPTPGVSGAIWRLDVAERDLDANVIALGPGESIAAHHGGDLDVLVHVIAGAGRILTDDEPVPVAAGSLVWLPRRSRRGFEAGEHGLRYLTVHRHKSGLQIRPMR